jgi:site-specific DNA-methyltransferase (adenine-specific)
MSQVLQNQIICGDCAKELSNFPDNIVDLTVTSPPYDDLRDYEGYNFDFESIARELYRVTKDGGVLVWITGDKTNNGTETGTSFKQALYFKEIGFNLHDTMIWHKLTSPLTHNRYEQHFEYMMIFSKNKPKTFNPIKEEKTWMDKRDNKNFRREKNNSPDNGYSSKNTMKIKGNVWRVNSHGHFCTNDIIAYQHPAIFPETLAQDHILSWSNKGDLVLDPFAGSGTTLKMAKLNKRNYLGIEISEKYCDIIKKRLEKYNNQSMETFC